MIMGENLTRDLEKLQAIKQEMLKVEMYKEEWFKLKEKWKKLFQKIEEKREINIG